jgi:hypothetical protein
MMQLVLPAFEHDALREISVHEVDRFIKTLAQTKSYSMAKQARTVLSLAFGMAVRYDAMRATHRKAHPPAATPEDRDVDQNRVRALLHRRGPAGTAVEDRSRRSGSPDLLQPERDPVDDEQRAPSIAGGPG